MEGQEKTTKTLKHLRLPEIINSEAETSETEELDKLSKLEKKIEEMDEKLMKIEAMDAKLGIILNKLNETLTWNIKQTCKKMNDLKPYEFIILFSNYKVTVSRDFPLGWMITLGKINVRLNIGCVR